MNGIAGVKTQVLSELVKPRPCNKCGEPIALITTGGKGKLFSYQPVNVIMSDDVPGMAIPAMTDFHFRTCVIAKLQARREKIQIIEPEGSVTVRVEIATSRTKKVLSVRSSSAAKASALIRKTLELKKYERYKIVSWQVLTD